MSNFNEEKIERSNDGKFAPKATSETDIDLEVDGGTSRIGVGPAPAGMDDLAPSLQQAIARQFSPPGAQTSYENGQIVLTHEHHADPAMVARNIDGARQMIESADQSDDLGYQFRLDSNEPVGNVGHATLTGLESDVHGRSDVGRVSLSAGYGEGVVVSAEREYDLGEQPGRCPQAVEAYMIHGYGADSARQDEGGRFYVATSVVAEKNQTLNEAIDMTWDRGLHSNFTEPSERMVYQEAMDRFTQRYQIARDNIERVHGPEKAESFDSFAKVNNLIGETPSSMTDSWRFSERDPGVDD